MTIAHSIDPLKVRRALGRDQWKPPVPYGPDGFIIENRDSHRLIVTVADVDGTDWIHCSLTTPNRIPLYVELTEMHRAVMRERWAYQVFAPPAEHANIHERALHLWGRLDGANVLPTFGVRLPDGRLSI